MLVCHCKAVTDRAVRAAVRSGAQTVSDVALRCGAGDHCGGCHDAVQELIHSESVHRAETHTSPASSMTSAAPDA